MYILYRKTMPGFQKSFFHQNKCIIFIYLRGGKKRDGRVGGKRERARANSHLLLPPPKACTTQASVRPFPGAGKSAQLSCMGDKDSRPQAIFYDVLSGETGIGSLNSALPCRIWATQPAAQSLDQASIQMDLLIAFSLHNSKGSCCTYGSSIFS